MLQDAFQVTEQAAKNDGRWPKGVSGNPRGRLSRAEIARRIEEMARSLSEEYGGFDALSPSEQLLVTNAARLSLMRIPRRHSDEVTVRVANSIGRLLGIVRKSRGCRHRPLRLVSRSDGS